MQAQEQAAKVNGPKANSTVVDPTKYNLVVLNITTSTQVLDILGDGAHTPSNPGALPRAEGRMVKMTPEVDVYYMWTDASGQLLDETLTGSTTPSSQCDRMYAGQPLHEFPQGRYLAVKGIAAGKVRMSVSSP